MSEISLSSFLNTPTHHAYLIIGEPAAHFEKSRLHVREKILAGELHAADAWFRAYESIGIDDAREIKEIQNTMPTGERRVVLISLETIQSEAQNSLLKLFEEPSVHTTFFVFARTPEIFLPTLLSRFNVVTIEAKESAAGINIGKFLSSTVAGRLEMLEPIIKEKDKNLAENFLNALETALHKNKSGEGDENGLASHAPQTAAIFEDIFAARRFLRSRSPSVKMILEHLSGSIPVVK